ncbi:MAG: hypothetical protein ACAI43_09860, partial [Phycisphaerae bacterium]
MRNSRGARLSGKGRRVDLLHGLEPRLLLCGQIHDGTMAVTFWSTDGSDDPLASYTVPTGASAFERTTWSVGPLVGPGSLLIKPKAVPAAVGPAARNALMSWVGVGTPQGPRLTPWTSGTVATSGAQSSSASPAGAAPVGAAPAPALDSPTDGGPAGSTYTLAASGLPLLHSNPTAPSMIFLDFDGDSTSSTNPYSEDADTATFNATEQASIISAWRQASAYWAMFNIDVSTEQPPAGMYRAWNAIGNNISGGYAYLNNFNTQQRAWGFNQSSNARDRVSGIVHEGGHIFNLQHQSAYDRWGTKTAEYLSAPDTLHGPLMGVDYSGSVHKWFIGHPANSVTGVQDDLAVISAKIKAREVAAGNAAADGYRPDDFGGTIGAGASVMTSSGASWEAAGIIERMSDVDVFSFVSDGGAYEISATPPAPSGADLKLDVYAANGTRLASDDDANNGQQLSLDLPAGTYYAAVASHGNYGDLGMYEVAARPLLPGSAWVSADVAPTTVWGYGEFDPSTGVFTNAGSGADVWGTSDSFHFTYQAIAGDATIVARVLSMENTNTTAKAGVDIRASLAANSQHAYVADSYGSGRVFGYRTTAGGSTSSVGGTTTAFAPYWLKLVRSGNTFTGSRSTDGVTWTTIGSQTITMGSTVYVGLMTTAVGSTKLNAATFDNVTVTGTAAGSVTNALPAPAGVTVVRPATGSGLTVNWSAVPGATGYTVERSDDGVTFAPVGTTVGNAVTTLTNSPTLGSMRYFFRVRASDATGASTPSAVIDAVNRPTAVTGLGTISVNTTTIKVYWKDTHGETGYRLERSADAGATWTTVQAALGTNV